MAVSVDLVPQADGALTGWSTIVGTTFAYEAVDDSAGATHDSDATYIILPRRVGTAGLISFPVGRLAGRLTPSTITLRVAAKIHSGGPSILIGFRYAGATGYHPTPWSPGAGYTVETRAFATNPVTGAAWAAGELEGLEIALEMDIVIGQARITLINGTATCYNSALDRDPFEPRGGDSYREV